MFHTFTLIPPLKIPTMLPKISYLSTPQHPQLVQEASIMEKLHLSAIFRNEANRFEIFSRKEAALLYDFSKQKVRNETLALLCEMARSCKLDEAIKAMFDAEGINETERRSALHIALRNRANNSIYVEGKDVMPDVKNVLGKMRDFSLGVNSGNWRGQSNKEITDIVNIGIGGSDLGPVMVCEALKSYKGRLNSHFVSNVDGAHLYETLKVLKPETTLFIIVSKTFSTQETMQNANIAREWIVSSLGEEAVAKHFVAVSTRSDLVKAFGIDTKNMFEFWNWVGGRYSLWSAVGLSISLSIGYDKFEELLEGAYEMDRHFSESKFEENIPVLMALISIWNQNYLGYRSLALIPYSQYLHRFPAYLQQADMESNGKSVDRNAEAVLYHTGAIVWGEPGTNGQHAFFQLLHQGTEIIPVDFILPAKAVHPWQLSNNMLISNCLAQSEALMNGKSLEQVKTEMRANGNSEAEIVFLSKYKVFDGDRPSNTIVLDALTPKSLGNLIAAYEHKIFVQGILWNIYSFDQFGVEMGKDLADKFLIVFSDQIDLSLDSQDLINHLKSLIN